MKFIFAALAAMMMVRAGHATGGDGCEARLEGHALRTVLEKALESNVCTVRELEDFVTSPGWYNLFARSGTSLANPMFRKAFEQISGTMSEGQRTEAKSDVAKFLREKRALNEVSRQSAEATREVLSPFLLPPLEFGSLTSDSEDSGVAIVDGRPVLYKPVAEGTNYFIALYDAFNPDPTKRLRKIPAPQHSYRSDTMAETFEWNGDVYVLFRENFLLYNLTRAQPGPALTGYLNEAQLARTPDGPAVIGVRPPQMQMIFANKSPHLFGLDLEQTAYLSVNQIGDRDIVAAADSTNAMFRDLMSGKDFPVYRYQRHLDIHAVRAPIVFRDGKDLLAALPMVYNGKLIIEIIDVENGLNVNWIELEGSLSKKTKFMAVTCGGKTKLVFETENVHSRKSTLHALDPRTQEDIHTHEFDEITRARGDPGTGFEAIQMLGRTLLVSGGIGVIYVFDPLNGMFKTFPVREYDYRFTLHAFTYQGMAYAFLEPGGRSVLPRLIQLTIAAP